MSDWDARLYLKFEDDRSRPARDLLAQVPLQRVRTAVDLGCGPGNSTELLASRYPEATLIGVDTSKDMLRQARQRLPGCTFVEADLRTWRPDETPDLFFANAVFQWIPDQQPVMRRAVGMLSEGGVFAVQMPDNTMETTHVLMRELAGRAPWADLVRAVEDVRVDLPPPESYYDLLKPLCRHVEIWHTIYNHVLSGPKEIVEWFRGSALRPYLSVLDASGGRDFLEAYAAEIAPHYTARPDGTVLLRFPRLFIVATR
jgi:trans-aconitate 2-methyltransferase